MRYSCLNRFRILLHIAIFGITALELPAAQAATSTTSFQVTATVLSACGVSTPLTLALGIYNPSAATALVSTTSFTVICSIGTPYSLGMSAGLHTGATVTTRKMTSPTATAGSNVLAYGLFKDASLSTNWDNSISAIGYSGTGLSQLYTVYGSIPANQYGATTAIDYADTITLTLTY